MLSTLATCTVLLIHGGSFVYDSPTYGGEVIKPLVNHTTELHYRFNDVPGAYLDARDLAKKLSKRKGPLVAYGESAGGTIATWLAARKRVDSAVTVGAPEDLRLWTSPLPSSRAQIGIGGAAWKWSPMKVYDGQRPVFQYHFEADPAVARVGQRLIGSHYTVVPGLGHMVMSDRQTRKAITTACKEN